MGAMQAFAERQVSIPGDVAVVSFDGSELATWLRPRVSSVAIPYADLGALAVEILLRGEGGSRKVSMPLMHGESL